MKKKISFMGAGNIGGTMASFASSYNYADIVLYDVNGDFAKGKALDIAQMNVVNGNDVSVIGTDDVSDIQDSDVVIITAGFPRKSDMTRDDLLAANIKVIDSIATNVAKYAPNAFCIMVTNPLDLMVFEFQKRSGLPKKRVVGMAGTLDGARFKCFLAKEFNVSVKDIDAMVLGSHGDSMVPVLSCVSINGMQMDQILKMGLITQEKMEQIVERVRYGGGEIVALLQQGSAFYAPAICALEIAQAFLLDKKRVLTVCAFLEGQYGGIKDMAFGVPAVIGAEGVEKIIELNLSDTEATMLKNSVNHLQSLISKLG